MTMPSSVSAKEARETSSVDTSDNATKQDEAQRVGTLLPPPFDLMAHSAKESRAHAGFQTDPSTDALGCDGVAWAVSWALPYLLSMSAVMSCNYQIGCCQHCAVSLVLAILVLEVQLPRH